MNFVASTISSLVSSSLFAAFCRPRLRELRLRSLFFPALMVATALVPQRGAGQIKVDPNTEGNTSGSACSLQEAIYATEFAANVAIDATDPDDTYTTGCSDASGEWNTIDLPGGALSFTKSWGGDAHNPFGPTATPIIFSTITIRGHGTTLQWNGPEKYRLFAIGEATITPKNGVLSSGTYSGTGNLTLQDVYVKGFNVKGGDGNNAGGGGLGAGGAIYLGKVGSGVPALTVENSTFESNGAVGGSSSVGFNGGGGGLGGNGGYGNNEGGGGGGSRGNGGTFNFNSSGSVSGAGGGGGTVLDGGDSGDFGGSGGYLGGGNGGDVGHPDGGIATGPGGGGGGGHFEGGGLTTVNGDGGRGAYGGGGGGGAADGGSGGFGGGGGGGANGSEPGDVTGTGGNGGFGGGGGGGNQGGGNGGAFGGRGGTSDFQNAGGGGAGGALGGAIFNDSGTVVVQNSTFFNNFVSHGDNGACSDCGPAGDSGGAIFSRNGSTTVQNVTISNNEATGAGGGIVVYKDGATTTFILDNTIIANNGAQECITEGGTIITSSGGVNSANNLIVNNSGCPNVTVPSDPMLDTQPKLNTPGDTPTMALLPGSPAIDAGDDTTALGTDQRGVQRPQGASSDIGAFERVPQADLSLSKAVSNNKFKAGDSVTYTLTLTNLGPDTANSITVTDNFPTALTYVSCSAPGGSCGPQGAAVVITYSSLAASSSATITITGTLNSGYSRGTVITNSVSVQDTSPADPDSTNNNASVSFTVIVPDFSISADSPITVPVGSSATSSVKITSIDTFSSAVGLTSSGPLGFDDSFNPSSVTPPSDGSASSTLTINLEPSVVPGTYSVTVTGTSGALTHSTTVTANVQATIDGTITVISTDQALGCIDNSGISGALQSKLNAAKADIAAGKIQEAINTLKALLNQLQAQAGKHISISCKDGSGNTFNPDAVLIADVKAILASLGVNVAADPIMGSVVNSSGVGISGLTVNLLNPSKSIISSATTDAMGFFYFPATGGLSVGATYTNKVAIVKPYKNTTPSSQSFTWKASTVSLKNFVIN